MTGLKSRRAKGGVEGKVVGGEALARAWVGIPSAAPHISRGGHFRARRCCAPQSTRSLARVCVVCAAPPPRARAPPQARSLSLFLRENGARKEKRGET